MADLNSFGIPADIVNAFPPLPADLTALMIYGSRARGDALPDSDLDVLGVVGSSRATIRSGLTSLSFYTVDELALGVGTLFGEHLRRDGRILFDLTGELAGALDRMDSVDTRRVLDRSQAMSTLFTTPERDLPKYLFGLSREARYLLRSCLYADAIGDGSPCFSVRELSIRHKDPALTELLASRPATPTTDSQYRECLVRLNAIVGDFPPNLHGSLESTVINEWDSSGDVLSMAFMALGTAGDGTSDYAEIEKILL
jgi:predicted nucleotidyltransferase